MPPGARKQTSRAPKNLAKMPWTKGQPFKSDATTETAPKSNLRPQGSNWGRKFRSSHDYFAFVKQAAESALHGDGAASLYISRALDTCHLQVALFGNSSDPQAAFQAWLATQVNDPEPMLAEFQRKFSLCRGFFNGNAFASLPPKKGGYLSASYWRQLAYKEGNPVAEVLHVTTEIRGFRSGARVITAAQKTLINAVSSGDPEAVFRAGFFLTDGYASSSLSGFAVAIAGCDLGYDCSANNPVIFGACAEFGQCPAGLTYADIVTKAIGPSGYARAYAMARQLEQAISQGDRATVAEFVQLHR